MTMEMERENTQNKSGKVSYKILVTKMEQCEPEQHLLFFSQLYLLEVEFFYLSLSQEHSYIPTLFITFKKVW